MPSHRDEFRAAYALAERDAPASLRFVGAEPVVERASARALLDFGATELGAELDAALDASDASHVHAVVARYVSGRLAFTRTSVVFALATRRYTLVLVRVRRGHAHSVLAVRARTWLSVDVRERTIERRRVASSRATDAARNDARVELAAAFDEALGADDDARLYTRLVAASAASGAFRAALGARMGVRAPLEWRAADARARADARAIIRAARAARAEDELSVQLAYVYARGELPRAALGVDDAPPLVEYDFGSAGDDDDDDDDVYYATDDDSITPRLISLDSMRVALSSSSSLHA